MDSPWLNMAHFVDRQRRLSNLFLLSRHGFHANNQLDGGGGGGRMERINTPNGVHEMNAQLEALIEKAISSTAACKVAVDSINGKTVEAYVVSGYRNTGKNRKPTIQWTVNGKRIAKANLAEAIA
jgi:hypothetical protein